MSHITIDDIWDSLLEAYSGYVILTLPSLDAVKFIKRNLIRHKYRVLKATPHIKQFTGEFRLRFKTEKQGEDYRLTISRKDEDINQVKIKGKIEVY